MQNMYPGITPISVGGFNPISIPAGTKEAQVSSEKFGVHKLGVVKQTSIGTSVLKVAAHNDETEAPKPEPKAATKKTSRRKAAAQEAAAEAAEPKAE